MISDIHRAVAALAVDYRVLSVGDATDVIAHDAPAAVLNALLEHVPVHQIYPAIARELGLEFYDLHSKSQAYHVEPSLLNGLNVEQLAEHAALPLLTPDGQVVVVMGNPNDVAIYDYVIAHFPNARVLLGDAIQIRGELLRFGSSAQVEALAAERPATTVSLSPTTAVARSAMLEYVDNIFNQAVAQDASDVHLEFNADGTGLLRYRIDGQLITQRQPPFGREAEIVGTILSRSSMNASNLLEPQDGTFSFVAAGRRIDTRVSFLPQENGPSVVARLLDSSNMNRRLDDMGFQPEHLSLMRRAAAQSQGMVIVCGPTGSGKTTTLYGLLGEIDAVHMKVATIEDPVEYRLPNIGQTQIRSDRGTRSLTFARVLRALLRQDPDAILVGECRDSETARTASEAAITGHLVLTTVHAPSAPAVYTRLVEMGVPAYSVAESITLVISQRLLRRVHECAESRAITAEDRATLESFGIEPPERAMYPVGCAGCRNTGYRGRIAAVEVLRPTRSLRRLVVERSPLEDIVKDARSHGFVDIMIDGMRHVRDGYTSIAEVLRVLERNEDSEQESTTEEID